MASKYWIKLYHEILDDPKMGRMPDRLWRRTIELFLLAGELNENGLLPEPRDIAWRLRLSDNDIAEDLSFLETYNIVHQKDGRYIITKFADRQSAMSSAERSRRYHESQKKEEYEQVHYGNRDESSRSDETNRPTDIDKDIDIDIDIDKDIDKDKNKILLKTFCEITGISLPYNPSTYAKWLQETSEWIQLGADSTIIERAVKLANEKDYTVARPKSITNFIRGEISKAKSDSGAEIGSQEWIMEMIEKGEL
jgi:hypothetical protein